MSNTKVYGGRSMPIHGRRSSHTASGRIFRNSQFFGQYNRKQHLTVEIIRIMILLRLSRERDEASIVTEAPGSVGLYLSIEQSRKLGLMWTKGWSSF
ncbi:hypothetical protein TNCV_1839991 [Trichonephila clavipes]|nr:hypothetical protein TNCV_1839991 [Trichonephila clavipes]